MEHLLYGLLFAVLFGLLVERWKQPVTRILRRGRWMWRTSWRTGLRAIYSRSDEYSQDKLRQLLDEANSGDQITVVSRTSGPMLRENHESVFRALQRGIRFRFLTLDRRAVSNESGGPRIDVSSLGLQRGRDVLGKGLSVADNKFRNLRERCIEERVKGSLMVFRTDSLVENSVVLHTHDTVTGASIEVLYDISFGDCPSYKFVQNYKQKATVPDNGFCARLQEFYFRKFEDVRCYLDYERSYMPPMKNESPLMSLETLGSDRVESLIRNNSDAEVIRNNPIQSILPAARKVFHYLSGSGDRTVPGPVSVQVELTHKCSTKCEHCLRYTRATSLSGNDDDEERLHMKAELAYTVLDQLAEIGTKTVTFSGGEPTQHPHFSDILRYAKKEKKLNIGVLSNGVGVSDEALDAIINQASWLRLSVDGSSPASYGDVRTIVSGRSKDAFRQVKDTIDRYINKAARNRFKCKLAICFTIQRKNVDDVKPMIDWVNGTGLPDGDKHLVFKFAHGTHGKGEYLCTRGDIEKLILTLNDASVANAANIPYLLASLTKMSTIDDLVTGEPTKSLYQQDDTQCFTPYLFTLIDPDGCVYPCCFLYEDNAAYTNADLKKRSDHFLGKIGGSETIDIIWRGAAYTNLRSDLERINPTDKYSSCAQCTRHYNHNRALTQLVSEYERLVLAECDADGLLRKSGEKESGDVWL